MPKPNAFHDHVMHDVLGHLPGITSRAMFGGYGIYQDGVIFGLIADDRLYFKAGDQNRAVMDAAGSEPFIYEMKGHRQTNMGYRAVPEAVCNDPDAVADWVARAVAVSKSKAKKK
jgi:DNA transformation protein